MIVGLSKNVPLVVKAVPESKIEGKWWSLQIAETIQSLHEISFGVRAVISDNQQFRVAVFNDLLSKFRYALHENTILYPSPTIASRICFLIWFTS